MPFLARINSPLLLTCNAFRRRCPFEHRVDRVVSGRLKVDVEPLRCGPRADSYRVCVIVRISCCTLLGALIVATTPTVFFFLRFDILFLLDSIQGLVRVIYILQNVTIFMNLLFGWHRSTIWESLFYVYVRQWCSWANHVAFHDYRQIFKMTDCQEFLIWLARGLYFSRLLGARGGSWRRLGAPCVPMVAPGGSWWKFMKTIVLLSKT